MSGSVGGQIAGTGVRINGICPGLIDTDMTAPFYKNARAKGLEDKIGLLNPLGRSGKPEEIARVALFLSSDAASYVHGHMTVAAEDAAADDGLEAKIPGKEQRFNG